MGQQVLPNPNMLTHVRSGRDWHRQASQLCAFAMVPLQTILRESRVNERPSHVSDVQSEIILAAEALFTSRGIEATSLRNIAASAGQGNTNAVRYHFGTKERLLASIFEYRLTQMDPARRRMLTALESADALGNARHLWEVIVLPILALVDDYGKHSYAGFMAQYLVRYRVSGIKHAADYASEVSEAIRRTSDLLLARISYVPREAALSRLALCHLMFLSMVARFDQEVGDGKQTHLPDALVEDTLDMIVAAFTAPHRRG